MYLKSDILFLVFHVVCGLHYDNVTLATYDVAGMTPVIQKIIQIYATFRELRSKKSFTTLKMKSLCQCKKFSGETVRRFTICRFCPKLCNFVFEA